MIRELFELARQHNLALILDETYNAFVDGAPHTLFSDPQWRDTFVHIASFGKTFALTGFRAGALIAGEHLIRQALKIQDSMAVCQPRLTQLAIQFGCEQLDQWVAGKAAMMARRSALFKSAFDHPDLPFSLTASGSFFAWVRHPWPGLDSRQAARRLVDAQLICLPGAAFGPGLDPYLRLAIGNINEEQIPGVIDRLLIV
jgi:aspartate/methionine/tyrosine aminotransferase